MAATLKGRLFHIDKEGVFVRIGVTMRDGQLHTVQMMAGIVSIPGRGAVERGEFTIKNTK